MPNPVPVGDAAHYLRLHVIDLLRADRNLEQRSQRTTGATVEDLDWLIELCRAEEWRHSLNAAIRRIVTDSWRACKLRHHVVTLTWLLDPPRHPAALEERRRAVYTKLVAESRRPADQRSTGAGDNSLDAVRRLLDPMTWPAGIVALGDTIRGWPRVPLTLDLLALAVLADEAGTGCAHTCQPHQPAEPAAGVHPY